MIKAHYKTDNKRDDIEQKLNSPHNKKENQIA